MKAAARSQDTSVGRPLPAAVRLDMERRLAGVSRWNGSAVGPLVPRIHPLELEARRRSRLTPEPGAGVPRHDFRGVRVHTDEGAARAAEGLGARAFTAGEHVVFGRGEYAPSTGRGRRLLAHELTHVAQRVPTIAREESPGGGTIPVGDLDLGPGVRRAREFSPPFRGRTPRVPPASGSWRTRVALATGQPPARRPAAFLDLINEALRPDTARFPDLTLPVTPFVSEAAAAHGDVLLEVPAGAAPGRRGVRATTRNRSTPTAPRVFIVLTPRALHGDAGPEFTRRTLHHEHVHFQQNVAGRLTTRRPGCTATFRGRPTGGTPDRETEATSITFARFFPTWADGASPDPTDPPHHIFEDLGLLRAAFRCAGNGIRAAATNRIVRAVGSSRVRRKLLIALLKEVSSRDTPSTTLLPEDDALDRLARALGARLPRDRRAPERPRPSFGSLIDPDRILEGSSRSPTRRLEETVP